MSNTMKKIITALAITLMMFAGAAQAKKYESYDVYHPNYPDAVQCSVDGMVEFIEDIREREGQIGVWGLVNDYSTLNVFKIEYREGEVYIEALYLMAQVDEDVSASIYTPYIFGRTCPTKRV